MPITVYDDKTRKLIGTISDEERQKCEIWTRVMGYHRPSSSFNVGKQGEFAERKYFREPGKCLSELRPCR